MMTYICTLKGHKELVSIPIWTNVDLNFSFACAQMSSWKIKSVRKQPPGRFIPDGPDAVSACLSICVIAEYQNNKIQPL